MNSFGYTNLTELLDSINHIAQYEHMKITHLHMDDFVIHIEFRRYLCDASVVEIFNRIINSIHCSQMIAQGYITEHIIEESTLVVEGDKVIMNFKVNREFDKNDYKR